MSPKSFNVEVSQGQPSCPLRRPFRRMVCTGHYLLVLFGGWSAELPYLSFSVKGLQYISPTCSGLSYLSFRLGGWSTQAFHMVCTYISPLRPFVLFGGGSAHIFGGWSASALLLVRSADGLQITPTCPSFHPFYPSCTHNPSLAQHCVHHSSCPIGPSPWWRCTLHSITIMKVIILLPKELSFRPPSPWWTLRSIIIMKIIILLLSTNNCRLGVVKLPG